MAALFDSTTDKLSRASFTVPTTGSLVGWWYPNWAQSDSTAHHFVEIADVGFANIFTIIKWTDNAMYCGWYASSTDHRAIAGAGTYTLNQSAWNSLILTWDDTANETHFYINGTLEASNTSTLVTWSTASETLGVGCEFRGNGNPNARTAEFAIFDVVLSAGERTAFDRGASPLHIGRRPKFYWPLENINRLVDVVGGATLTNANVTSIAHPKIIRPRPRIWRPNAAAAGGIVGPLLGFRRLGTGGALIGGRLVA